MSYALEVYLTNLFQTDSTLVGLLGARPDGVAGIYPYHHRDIANPTYPMITIARFGTKMGSTIFSDTIYATMMDAPRLAICAWAKNDVDQAIAVATRVRQLVKQPQFNPGNSYFVGYKLTERLYRDDLFDTEISAYHVHLEFDGWVQERYGNPQPIGT